MRFLIDSGVYDSDQLSNIGIGSFASVYDIGRGVAAKIYHDPPTDEGVRKLTRLFDVSRSLQGVGTTSGSAALPESPAISVADAAVVGFAMKGFSDWLPLSALRFSRDAMDYKTEGRFKFTDTSAVSAIYAMFGVLNDFASRHLTIGDISAGNILVNPANAAPGFIDLDDSDFEEWDSSSLGTAGYVDPRLFEGNLNSAGGYDFDAQSDVFALTVVAYSLVMGVMPFSVPLRPATWKEEDFLRHRISNLRVLIEGDTCLRPHQKVLVEPELLKYLQGRVEAVRRVRGKSGADGNLLMEHFQQVFLAEQRLNLLDGLAVGDPRSSSYEMLTRTGTTRVLNTLQQQFGGRRTGSTIVLPALQRRTGIARRDPRSFDAFLAARGITLDAMVSPL